ncbi:MAG: dephospho-CoA kinase [Candidatus Aminicenantes bacterium]|nr:dephospho-CoA kinase [Candidatus Aminicenantes bacterium]
MTLLNVALTGGIACGKSVVASVFREKGCYVHSADRAAHEFTAPETPSWRAIVERFGPEVVRDDRTIDRGRLGRIVFADPEARSFLSGLLHPLVMAKTRELVRDLEQEGRVKIFISEAALTIEAGFASFFDRVVVVTCPEELQVRRLAARDGLERDEALRRIRSQQPATEKRRAAHYVIETSGTLAETIEQSERVYAALMRDYEDKRGRAAR